MLETMALIKRRDDRSREAFREHYERVHVPLALPILTGLQRYVRYHVIANRLGDFAFDVLTSFGYRDRSAAERVFANLASEAGRPILEDEQRFMDTAANRFFAVSPRCWQDGCEGDEQLFVVVARPVRLERSEACARLTREHWPRLLDALAAPRFVLLRDAFPMQGGDLPCDALLQIEAEEAAAGLARWSKHLEAEGYRVAAVETRRFETPIED